MEDKQDEDYVAWLDQLWAQRLGPSRETRPEQIGRAHV